VNLQKTFFKEMAKRQRSVLPSIGWDDMIEIWGGQHEFSIDFNEYFWS